MTNSTMEETKPTHVRLPSRYHQRKWRQRNMPRANGKPRRSYIDDYSVLVALACGAITAVQAGKILGLESKETRTRMDEVRKYGIDVVKAAELENGSSKSTA